MSDREAIEADVDTGRIDVVVGVVIGGEIARTERYAHRVQPSARRPEQVGDELRALWLRHAMHHQPRRRIGECGADTDDLLELLVRVDLDRRRHPIDRADEVDARHDLQEMGAIARCEQHRRMVGVEVRRRRRADGLGRTTRPREHERHDERRRHSATERSHGPTVSGGPR